MAKPVDVKRDADSEKRELTIDELERRDRRCRQTVHADVKCPEDAP